MFTSVILESRALLYISSQITYIFIIKLMNKQEVILPTDFFNSVFVKENDIASVCEMQENDPTEFSPEQLLN